MDTDRYACHDAGLGEVAFVCGLNVSRPMLGFLRDRPIEGPVSWRAPEDGGRT